MLEKTKWTPSQNLQAKPRFPRQGEWTYDDWLNFPDDGWTYEIIDGVLYMAPPPAPAPQNASTELSARMRVYAEDNHLGKVLAAPCGVRLPGQSVPIEPDILFIKQEHLDIIGPHYVEGVPDMVVEIISPSNPNYDRRTKFELYQKAGVSEYWLVDYQAQTVEIFVLQTETYPEGDEAPQSIASITGTYTRTGKYTPGDTAVSTQLIDFKIAVHSLFNL